MREEERGGLGVTEGRRRGQDEDKILWEQSGRQSSFSLSPVGISMLNYQANTQPCRTISVFSIFSLFYMSYSNLHFLLS